MAGERERLLLSDRTLRPSRPVLYAVYIRVLCYAPAHAHCIVSTRATSSTASSAPPASSSANPLQQYTFSDMRTLCPVTRSPTPLAPSRPPTECCHCATRCPVFCFKDPPFRRWSGGRVAYRDTGIANSNSAIAIPTPSCSHGYLTQLLVRIDRPCNASHTQLAILPAPQRRTYRLKGLRETSSTRGSRCAVLKSVPLVNSSERDPQHFACFFPGQPRCYCLTHLSHTRDLSRAFCFLCPQLAACRCSGRAVSDATQLALGISPTRSRARQCALSFGSPAATGKRAKAEVYDWAECASICCRRPQVPDRPRVGSAAAGFSSFPANLERNLMSSA